MTYSSGSDSGSIRLDGKVAIVTGAGGGLGRAHALQLSSHGASVVVNDVGGALDGGGSDTSPAADVVATIVSSGGDAVASHASVATSAGGESIVDTAIEAFGSVDIVVNNAGILRDKSFAHMTDELVDPVLDVHLRGAFHVTRPAWVLMRESGRGGVVINTASSAGLIGNPGQANYAAAKMALVGLTRVLAAEGARHGIRANAIAPLARTRMTESVMGALLESIDPGYVSALVVALAHGSCDRSGHVYTVGGGRVARFFVGMTDGWFDRDDALVPERILENLGDIDSADVFSIPDTALEEIHALRNLLRSDTQ